MASWQEAMQAKLEENEQLEPRIVPSALIGNEECEREGQRHAGSIEWNYRTSTFEVHNANTQESRRGLLETEIENALDDLDVANSDWH
jgi:hypothetical protein